MYNKNHWQYKGLVHWYRLDGQNDFIKDEISGRRVPYPISTSVGFKNTDSTFNYPLPNGLRGRPFFSYLSASLQPGFQPDTHMSLNGITCSFWFIQKQATSSDYWLYYEFDGTLYPIAIRINSSNQILIHNNTNSSSPVTFSPTYSYKQWHHCVVVLTSTTVTLFLDGVKYTTTTSARPFGTRTLTYSGFGYNSLSAGTSVLLHDLRVYNYSWSDGQCTKFYSSLKERIALFTKPSISKYTAFSISNITIPFHTLSTIPESSGIDVYISGTTNFANDSVYLYTQNSITSLNSNDFYIGGLEYSANNITEYLGGYDINNSGNTLYIKGKEISNNEHPFYINGVTIELGGLNLVCDADGNPHNKSVPMFLQGATAGTSSIVNSVPITLYNEQTTDPRNGINFFIRPSNELKSASMNMVVGNTENHKNLQTTFYIHGPDGILNSGIPMYINTPVGTTGTVPFDGGLNMFINRPINNYAANVPMYLKTNEETSIGTTTFINGANIVTDSNKLYIEGSGVPTNLNNNTIIFVRGGE